MSILTFFGVLIISVIIITCISEIKDRGNTTLAIVLFIFIIVGSILILVPIFSTPTALDVYQGKTELRITYDGKVPVDSVVIYKKGDKE